MTTALCPVYLFRSSGFAPSGDAVVSVAPLDRVVAVYGDGGVVGEGGLSSSFGGAAVFKNDASGECFIGGGTRSVRNGTLTEFLHIFRSLRT
jgi:hypothetical protein